MVKNRKTFVINAESAAWVVLAHSHIAVSETLSTDQLASAEWLDIGFPVDVLSSIQKIKKNFDPYFGKHDLDYRWIEDVDWCIRARFDLPAEFESDEHGLVLVLEDVDCYAEVFLNGVRLGFIENQFHQHRFQLDEVSAGPSELLIYIRSNSRVTQVLERAHGRLPSGFDTPRVHARRCQCLTGWDWAARLNSSSIMSPPRLETDVPVRIAAGGIYVKEMPAVNLGADGADHATLQADVEVYSQRRIQGRMTIKVGRTEEEAVTVSESPVRLAVGVNRIRATFKLSQPALWWPLGMGQTPIYHGLFLLEGQDRTGNPVHDSLGTQFGVRTIAIDRKRDSEGESFIPTVNGHPVFCRGANWIPMRMLPQGVQEQDYTVLLGAAVMAGMNCLRVWGGGIYERDYFYDTCDRLGILVWQDFMFACAAYPTYREFLNEVTREADFQLKQLRNHPSIMIWCGNNENEWLHQIGELRAGSEKRIIGEEIWSRLLKDRCEDLDPSRPYHQSSPFGRNRDDYNDMMSGDRHSWECWARWQTFNSYLADTGRFISEFGMQGMPSIETIRAFAPDAQDMNDPVLVHHQKAPQGQERLARYVSEMFELPHALEDWVEATQRLQAEVLRRAVEHWRRRKFFTAGALIWQLNDAYPAISWSLIDFFFRPKQAYSAAHRFFWPVLLSAWLEQDGREVGAFDPQAEYVQRSPDLPIQGSNIPVVIAEGDSRRISVVLVNDTRNALAGTLRVLRARGNDVAEVMAQTLACQANTSTEPLHLTLEEAGITDIRRERIIAEFEPDVDSASAMDALAILIHDRIAALKWPENLTYDFRQMKNPRILKAERLLVEPKFFAWPDDVTVDGKSRPRWHTNPRTRE